MNIPKLGNIGKTNVSNVVFDGAKDIGKKVGLVKEDYSYLKIAAIVLALAFVGINIFTYFSAGVDAVTYFISNISIIKPIADVSRQVTAPIGAGIDKTIDLAEDTVKQLSSDVDEEESEDESEPEPDYNRKNNQIGWCYVGTDNNYRSCVKVGEMDECLSGKVYRTEEVCHNPTLRP